MHIMLANHPCYVACAAYDDIMPHHCFQQVEPRPASEYAQVADATSAVSVRLPAESHASSLKGLYPRASGKGFGTYCKGSTFGGCSDRA